MMIAIYITENMNKPNNLNKKIEVYLTPTTLKDLKDICEQFSFTMSTFVRLAIQDKLRAEKFIRSQSTNNQENTCSELPTQSEAPIKQENNQDE